MKKYIAFSLLATVLMYVGFSYAQSRTLAAELIQQSLLESKEMNETRPTMNPSLFAMSPKVNKSYKAAKNIPGALDKVFCYCYCSINPNFKHKSLLTCYVDRHAVNCGVCMNQALDTEKMVKAGKTPEEIAAYFKKKYMRGHNH